MIGFALVLIFAGILGFAMATFLVPVLASIFLSRSQSRAEARHAFDANSIRVSILVPAHNEELVLEASLKTLIANRPTELWIALDSCTDRSLEIAQRLGAKTLVVQNRSKWKTLLDLVRVATGDWVALVDAGTLWPENFLDQLKSTMCDESIFGINPSYAPRRGGLVETLHWKLEHTMKSLENAVGGPVSSHGATVFYRRESLLKALAEFDRLGFSQMNWLNDDIVLPMMQRALEKHRSFVFVEGREDTRVDDIGLRSLSQDGVRRSRMVRGNLQWIRLLWPQILREDFGTGFLALRRMFRVFWAWWLSLILVPALGLWIGEAGVGVGLSIVAIVAWRWPAFAASLSAVWMLFGVRGSQQWS